jgi:hypothetical protein
MIVPQPHSLVVRLLEQTHRALTITERGCDGGTPPGVCAAQEGPIDPFQPEGCFQRLFAPAEVHQRDASEAAVLDIVWRFGDQPREQGVPPRLS